MKHTLRNILLHPNGLTLIHRLRTSNKPVLLIGTPIHKNLGDHLIALNEIEFLKSIYPNRALIEIPTDIFFNNNAEILDNTPADATIFITGGGWMGDVWPDDEYRMQSIINEYYDREIIIFPQTIYYSNELENNSVFADAKNMYKKSQNLTLLLRDRRSYEFALCEFNNIIKQISLFPDMGLYQTFGEYIPKDIHRIGLCLRDDREQVYDTSRAQKLKNYLESKGYQIEVFSTIDKHGVATWNRKKKILELIRLIQTCDCVITDRLHGMIFTAISGIKCIVLDNKTKKVSGVYKEWLSDNNQIKLISNDSNDDELEYSIELLVNQSINTNWDKEIRNKFNFLANSLRTL